ncbi:RHS repeat domain-containing protein, partial [Duganella sp. S19_KUP01_CR8]|uniref:RHS repeat domain-containing protein n=1 Tax=Duganella sp. S19_KUP01_CR8 TaxID=3025502 RepID=UPI002FCD91F7
KLSDPDLGVVQYTPDPLGRVVAQSTPELRAKSQAGKMGYDELDRMTSRAEPDLTSAWEYDTAAKGKGQLATAYTTLADGSKDYQRIHTYDSLGRPSTTSQVLFDATYKATPSYDAWSRVSGQTYQRGTDAAKSFALRYNDKGYLATIERGNLVLWKVTSQDAAGRSTSVSLGNALVQTIKFDLFSARLTGKQLTTADLSPRLDEGYAYDAVGSVLQRTQGWKGSNFIEDFRYDELGRLKTSTIGSATQTFTYFADGSIKNKSNVNTADYSYPTGTNPAQPHAVQGFEGSPVSFTYDKNGNLLTGMSRTVSWTSFDMPLSINKGGTVVGFVYGPEHQRTRQVRGAEYTVYAGAQEVENTAAGIKVKTYWPQGVGVEIDEPNKAIALYWTHADRLGSPAALSDQNGDVQESLAYDAWGKRRALTTQATDDNIDGKLDNKGYTGHEMLDTVDLVHMNGRVYDPLIGRFLSADPLVQDPKNGQSYNRYSYVLNNPTNLTDPTGFASCSSTVSFSECTAVRRAGGDFEHYLAGAYGALISGVKAAVAEISGTTPSTRPIQGPSGTKVDAKSANNATVNGATYQAHLDTLESAIAPGRTLGEIRQAQTASGDFGKSFIPGNSTVDGISDLHDGKIVAGMIGIASEIPVVKITGKAKGLVKEITHEVMSIFSAPLSKDMYLYQKVDAGGQHLKYGTTINPTTRYSAKQLNGGRLKILAQGTSEDMLKLERDLHETLPIGPEEFQKFYIQMQTDKGLLPPPYK